MIHPKAHAPYLYLILKHQSDYRYDFAYTIHMRHGHDHQLFFIFILLIFQFSWPEAHISRSLAPFAWNWIKSVFHWKISLLFAHKQAHANNLYGSSMRIIAQDVCVAGISGLSSSIYSNFVLSSFRCICSMLSAPNHNDCIIGNCTNAHVSFYECRISFSSQHKQKKWKKTGKNLHPKYFCCQVNINARYACILYISITIPVFCFLWAGYKPVCLSI